MDTDPPRVRIAPLDDAMLDRLTRVAVADAAPAEVMPPVGDPDDPRWSDERQAAFGEFHRVRGREPGRRTFAILDGDRVVGSIRLDDADDRLETGLWLGRSHRGDGVGSAAVAAVLVEAARIGRDVVADTTTGNAAALAVLTRLGADLSTEGDAVRAHLAIDRP